MKYLVCFGHTFPEGDRSLAAILENYSAKRQKECFVPEIHALLLPPIAVDSQEEIKDLELMEYELSDAFLIIDTEFGYAHVCNGRNIEIMEKECLPRFKALYEKYGRNLFPKINGIGEIHICKKYFAYEKAS